MRPHGGVRALAGAKVQRRADAGRPALRFAVQYVPQSRAAARADCQSRRGISSRRARPGSGGLLLFCSQRERRALLQPHAGRAQSQCRAVSPPAGADRAGTERRRCAARSKRRRAKETGAPKAQLMTKANAGHSSKKQMILELARLGRRRAEMIARNRKVEPQKRAEKEEMMNWFKIWLETPDAFFDWIELRKQSPEYQKRFPHAAED